MPWVDAESGETFDECPNCAAMERERRTDRIARAKAEKAVEHAQIAKRDGALWKRLLDHWLSAFPDKRPSASGKGIKSARATKTFMRLERGATEDEIHLAIEAARVYPYLVFGERVRNGAKSNRRDDLEDIVSIDFDKRFDDLLEKGSRISELQ